ncbi:uncharacterized protein BX664DRAFT_355767 [Halteromyces radiatus]|uniref:uncharacterized protein n=1 Tax=Halteromyces radiatus TaxID=101107 RepID=UPI00221EB525|nr:uncharacterized protein BX664DRAFT_355767 [Halteromyces radiatus]KAI8096400.1 hypothetical protein BX664DRAFT_355767 [Halteromyces radiatus]
MKKKGSKMNNNESPVVTSTNTTNKPPPLPPSTSVDILPRPSNKKKKKKKNKQKSRQLNNSPLAVLENAQQQMGAAVAAAAVADFHHNGAEWFSSSQTLQQQQHYQHQPPPPPPPPPSLPPPPRQLPSSGLNSHHQHSSHVLNNKQRNKSINKKKDNDKDEFWSSMSNTEERQKIREFWLQLGEDERRSLVKVEKEAVLRKMKEQQKHSCNCSVCGKKRTAIEDELEVLYDAYYEELEQYANHQQHTQLYGRRSLHTYPTPEALQEGHFEGYLDENIDEEEDDNNHIRNGDQNDNDHEDDDDEDEDDDDDDDEEEDDDDDILEEDEDTFDIHYEDDHRSDISDDDFSDAYDDDLETFTSNGLTRSSHGTGDHFNFGNSLTVKGGILTVADDLLKNDGKKFLDMMERLAERRMQRDIEAELDQDEDYYDEDEDEEDMYDDENEEDTRTEEQRMEEGRRMFQIFAARMFEQRVLAAYREKVAKERQQRLIQELEEEDRQRQERELKKQRDKERKKDKKRLLKQQQERERRAKEEQRLAEEAKKRAELEQKQEAERQKKEQERQRKEQERQKKEEERRIKEEEKRRRLKEEKERVAEKERQRKEKEEREHREKEFLKEKERKEKELKDELARRDRELKEQIERHERQKGRIKSDAITKPTKSTSTSTSSIIQPSLPNSLSSKINSPKDTNNTGSREQLLMDALNPPTSEQQQQHTIPPTAVRTNNVFKSPTQHLFSNGFPPLDVIQPSHPLLGSSLDNSTPPLAPPSTQQQQHLLKTPIGIFPSPMLNVNGIHDGNINHVPFQLPMESSLSTSNHGRSSINAISQLTISNSSSSSSTPVVSTPPPSTTSTTPGISIPLQHGRRSSAMAGPVGSPVTHRFGAEQGHQESTIGPHRASTADHGADHSFFSNFLFGEPNRGSNLTTPMNEVDALGYQTRLDMPLDRRFSTESPVFGWRNGWSATSLLSENVHGNLFGDSLTDRHTILLDRAKSAYQKLDEITQTKFFLGGTTPYHTMTQLHRMMNDLYCDMTVDTRELYDVLVQSPQSGFQCIQHPQHGMVVKYHPSTTSTNADDPLLLRRSSTLLHNTLSPSTSSFSSSHNKSTTTTTTTTTTSSTTTASSTSSNVNISTNSAFPPSLLTIPLSSSSTQHVLLPSPFAFTPSSFPSTLHHTNEKEVG